MIEAIGKTRSAPNTVKANVEELEENLYQRLAKGGEEQHNGIIEMSITVNRKVYEEIEGAKGGLPKKITAGAAADNDEYKFYNGSIYNDVTFANDGKITAATNAAG